MPHASHSGTHRRHQANFFAREHDAFQWRGVQWRLVSVPVVSERGEQQTQPAQHAEVTRPPKRQAINAR